MTVPLKVDVQTPQITIALPQATPLVCDTNRAIELFGLSRTTLYALRKQHSDFPARTVGHSVCYLVPELYAWLRDYPGGQIPINEKPRPAGKRTGR